MELVDFSVVIQGAKQGKKYRRVSWKEGTPNWPEDYKGAQQYISIINLWAEDWYEVE